MKISLRKIVLPVFFAFVCLIFLSMRSNEAVDQDVNFTVRGNGKFLVELGIGSSVGYGACCRGVSQDSYVGFNGKVGDVLYDSKTKRVLVKVHADLDGETIDLRQYY